ncbi:MAG TPA: ABC-F family ATP-binding cassette domain-containing protein [Solirubrobacteraceae bacterium]|nr:ABC-F family ATP-binding cassette domain-containing protein [Solirubrobacteraceae bacterium]
MALLTASDLRKDIAGQPLLRGVSFKLERRERLTLAGRNGAGKTTLLRMLAGDSAIDGGELSVARGVRIALHDQRPPRERGGTLQDYLLSGCAEELAIEHELAELERAMGEGSADEATLTRYAAAQSRLEARGGYLWRNRASDTAHGLGFRDGDLGRTLDTFSGGELTRASLARALATGADVLLLDEPTNHLDIASLEWLEQALAALDAAVVLVAHDRWFLEAVGTAVLELQGGRTRFFAGSWHAWRREQAARELSLGRAIAAQQAEIERTERFIERFRYKATKARQAQARVKRLEKMQRLERDPRDDRGLEFSFKAPQRSGRVIFELQDALVQVGGEGDGGGGACTPVTLLEHAELWLERGEHVTLVGPNGAGKTTLIEILAGRRELPAGKLSVGHNVKIGYLSQHTEELGAGGPPGQTVLEAAQHATGLTPGKARALLGRFLFSGEQAEKPLAGLSGGERRRLSLAVLVGAAHPPNVLILDEPTNHLDLDSREALEDALRAFPGAILLVSHDRALLDAVGTRTVAVEDGTLRTYLGGWADYARDRDERRARAQAGEPADGAGGATAGAGASSNGAGQRAAADAAGAGGTRADGARAAEQRAGGDGQRAAGPGPKRPAKPKGPSKNRLNAQQRAEAEVEAAEASLRELEAELSQPEAWATRYESAKSEARHTAARRAVEAAYERLQALTEDGQP